MTALGDLQNGALSDEGAFDAINHRLESEVAPQGVAALIAQLADRPGHLFVGVRGDILHQQICQAGVPLEDGEHLLGAVAEGAP
jgi:hypothetical protein